MRKIVIAIDGPAASGKSTTAKLVARRLGYLHIDTGAMYRAITLRVLEERIALDDVKSIRSVAERSKVRLERIDHANRVLLDGRDVTKEIRSREVTRAVSMISSYQPVRDVLVREQRRIAKDGGVVLEGRDIGTVVLPMADLKIYMVASADERATRRKKELEQSGTIVDRNVLEQEILERDRKDTTRAASPLQKAADAIELDTSSLTIDQQVEFVIAKANKVIEKST
ncbi:MAG: (d)CMP kinase [Ignavibacteriales bacterium]|nr:(d)CMP kinase [Ignavibacteriales bacterium]